MAGLIPFGHRHSLSRGIDDLDFWGSNFLRDFFGNTESFSNFRVAVKEKEDRYEIDAELPGLHREMMDVSYEDGILKISANMNEESKKEEDSFVVNERRFGRVSRSFSVKDVNRDEITAEYKDGVLKIVLPKSTEPKDKTHKIDIR